jgi:hypothetical protein
MNPDHDEDDDSCMVMLAFWGTVALLFLGTVMHELVGWLA